MTRSKYIFKWGIETVIFSRQTIDLLFTLFSTFMTRLMHSILPSHGGLEVERPLRIQLKAGHSYLGGFESRLGHGYVDIICNIKNYNLMLLSRCYYLSSSYS